MSSDNAVDPQLMVSQDLKALGFEAGELVYFAMPKFTKEDLKDALFESTIREPLPLQAELRSAPSFDIYLVITLMRRVYARYAHLSVDRPSGRMNHPDWYLEGHVMKSMSDPLDDEMRFRAFIFTGSDGSPVKGLLQSIPDSPDPDGLVLIAE